MSSSNSTDNNPYGYIPTKWICITFLTLFSVSTIFHIIQAIRSRFWWLFPSAIFCGVLEVIGWSGRLWSSQNPSVGTPYILQAVVLVIAPTPLVAANFILLGRIIQRLGPQYSRLTLRRYIIIFIFCDIISLIFQAVGGGIASGSLTSGSLTQAKQGSDLALGGTSLQLVSIIAHCALAAEFLTRYMHDRPAMQSPPVRGEVIRGRTDSRLHRMLQTMTIMTIFIVIRTIYRVVEFANGRGGKVMDTQWFFNVFDGTMIVLAMYTLNLFHPGIYLREDYPSKTSSEGTSLESVVTEHGRKPTFSLGQDKTVWLNFLSIVSFNSTS